MTIGRKVSPATVPDVTNGYFDAKVLSRAHAELSMSQDMVWIQDLKSSNGTFVNGERLSEEGVLSTPKALQSGDLVEFGVDIKDDNGKLLYSKVAAQVTVTFESGSNLAKIDRPISEQRAQDSTELLRMIHDEKTLSLEAAEALEKIKVSFDEIQTNAFTKSPQRTLQFETSKLNDINDKIDALFKDLNQQKTEITLFQDLYGSKVDLRALKETVEKVNEAVVDNKVLSNNMIKSIEKEVTDRIQKTESLLNQKLDRLESSLNFVKQDASLERAEHQRLNDLNVQLREEVNAATIKFEAEQNKNEQLNTKLTILTSKTNQLENHILSITKNIERLKSGMTVADNKQAGWSMNGLVLVVLVGICASVLFQRDVYDLMKLIGL